MVQFQPPQGYVITNITMSTDTGWVAEGDLIVGTGLHTAAILSKGDSGKFLQVGASTLQYTDNVDGGSP